MSLTQKDFRPNAKLFQPLAAPAPSSAATVFLVDRSRPSCAAARRRGGERDEGDEETKFYRTHRRREQAKMIVVARGSLLKNQV